MADDKLTGEQVAHGIMAEGTLTDLQSYLARGRQLETLSTTQLQERWIEAARTWGEAPFEPPAALNDVTSEYTLRKVDAPYHLVRDDLEKAIIAITERAGQMTHDEKIEASAAMIADYEKNSRTQN